LGRARAGVDQSISYPAELAALRVVLKEEVEAGLLFAVVAAIGSHPNERVEGGRICGLFPADGQEAGGIVVRGRIPQFLSFGIGLGLVVGLAKFLSGRFIFLEERLVALAGGAGLGFFLSRTGLGVEPASAHEQD